MKNVAKLVAPVALVLASFGATAGEGPAQVEIQKPAVQSTGSVAPSTASTSQTTILPGA
jgi:hypothetical protein